MAACGIVYQLIIGSISTYLLGNSVFQFSITIGLFMFSMGIGSILSKIINKNFLEKFILIEILIAIAGGLSGIILFLVFPFLRFYYEILLLMFYLSII